MENRAYILPTYPWIKLSNEINDHLKLFPNEGIPFPKENLKRMGFIAKDHFEDEIREIDYIIFPEWSEKIQLKKLSLEDSLKHLLESSYGFFDSARKINKLDFNNYTHLIKKTNMFRLKHTKVISDLDLTYNELLSIFD